MAMRTSTTTSAENTGRDLITELLLSLVPKAEAALDTQPNSYGHGQVLQLWTVILDLVTIERDTATRAWSEALTQSSHAPPPITRLPTELLILILAYDLEEEAPCHYYLRLSALSHVSQHWHAIVHQTPLFWTKIDSTYGTNQAELCIARSLGVPLHLCIDYWDGPQAGDALENGHDHQGWLDILGPVSRRWRELHLRNPPGGENLILRYLSYPADDLRRLSLVTSTERHASVETEIFAGTRPPLEALSVCGFVVTPLCCFNGESLVEFELVSAPCSVDELLAFLLQTPVLVTLRFLPSRSVSLVYEDDESEAGESEEAGLEPTSHPLSGGVPSVYLPLLKAIDLRIAQNSASDIFRSIVTPSLENLRLTSTFTPRSQPLRTILHAASPILQQMDQLDLSVSFRMRRIGVSLRQHSNSSPHRGLSLDIHRDSSFDPSANDPSDSLTSVSTIFNAIPPNALDKVVLLQYSPTQASTDLFIESTLDFLSMMCFHTKTIIAETESGRANEILRGDGLEQLFPNVGLVFI